MCEFRKLLHHLNKRIATPICWFTLMNMIYALSATINAFRHLGSWSDVPIQTVTNTLGNVVLWLILGFFPFFQVWWRQIFRLLISDTFIIPSKGCLLDIDMSTRPDMWTPDTHPTIRPSQYVRRRSELSATLCVLHANVRQIVSHAHSGKLFVLCNSLLGGDHSHIRHVPQSVGLISLQTTTTTKPC